MSDDFPTPDEIINGTYRPKAPVDRPSEITQGFKPTLPPVDRQDLKAGQPMSLPPDKVSIYVPPGMTMDEEQKKALSIVMSGLPFVIVAVRQTFSDPDQPQTATGSDFITELRGEADALLGARPHLSTVIERLYSRKGLL